VPIPGQSNGNMEPLRPTGRMNFARLNTDDSDDVIDDDETYVPPTNLGKRERLSSVKEELAGTRRTRLVRLIIFQKYLASMYLDAESQDSSARYSSSRGK
jgi:hypothetical protein